MNYLPNNDDSEWPGADLPQLTVADKAASILTLHDARVIAEFVDLASTKHMSPNERLDGTRKMLNDLERLAKDDGCVAAGWAIEWITAMTDELE